MPVDPPALSRAIHDPKRLDFLESTDLLDSPPEESFDRFTRLASNLMDTPVAMISLVDKNRQYFKSQHGLSEPLATKRETPLSHSFCKHLLITAQPLIVPDARIHPQLRRNPAITQSKVVAYLGVPLRNPEGQTLGALCTIDSKPREWTDEDVTTLQDLGVGVMTEIQLRLLARHFSQNYLEVRDLELQRIELTQMLVHDLRNPLNSLLVGLQLIEDTLLLDEKGRQYLSVTRLSGDTLMRMVNDILDVGKAEAGKLRLDLSRCLPQDIIEIAHAQTELMAYSAGVKIITEFDPELPYVRLDAEKFRRVLVNLISNAIQHTPATGTVRLSAYRSPDQRSLIFKVADTGFGISEEHFGQIFEKFGAINTRSGGRVSTGLGLPFCKLAIEAHGGNISLESKLGSGTVFSIEIPCGAVSP